MNNPCRKLIHLASTLALSLALPALAAAQQHAPQPPPLLSHEELQKRLADPKLRVVDSRPKADYDKGHVPGAVWIDGKTLQENSKPEAIADASVWSQALAPLGLGAETEVYVIGGPRQDAARIWWLLGYAGVKHVGLVDGGFPLWEKQGRPVTSEVPAISPKPFSVQFHARRIASRADVQAAIAKGESQVLDIRSVAEYRGEKVQHPGTRPGHVPTARSLDAHDLIDADGKFVDAAALRKRLAEAGIDAGRPVIVYSNTGSRASLAVFALRRLGVHARSYYQGLADWSSDASAPLILGDKPGDASPAR
jgi:thiosulfate/3-mercaptopyruvate sulfurtransferase